MKKSLFHLFIALLFSSSLFAQAIGELNADSLVLQLQRMPNDTLKVPVLILLGQQYEGNSPDKAAAWYKAAEQLSIQLHYERGIIQYIKNYTQLLNVQGKYDSSLALN